MAVKKYFFDIKKFTFSFKDIKENLQKIRNHHYLSSDLMQLFLHAVFSSYL